MFHTRWYRWTGVALGVMLSGGVAVAAPEGGDTSAQEDQSSSGDTAGCKEAGVTVTFATGSTNINARGRTSLNAVAKWAKMDPGRTIRVDGYTDKTGNPERNKVLSEKRADSVKTYLMARGVDENRIMATGHGQETERPDLKNTRAVAVTACAPPKTAEAPPPEEKPAEQPAPVAETVPEVPPPPPPPTVVETPPPPPPVVINNNMMAPAPHPEMPQSVIGVGVTLGGGAVGFWQDGTKSFVDIGGSWDVRATIGTRLPIAFEAAYVGTAQGVNALGLDTNAILLGSTAEGDIRINILRGRIQPYVFGGAGWTNYRITNTAIATSDLQRTDNVLEIPFGAGVSARLGHAFLLDIRGTGRWTFDDDLFKTAAAATNAADSHLYNWMGTAHLGWEF